MTGHVIPGRNTKRKTSFTGGPVGYLKHFCDKKKKKILDPSVKESKNVPRENESTLKRQILHPAGFLPGIVNNFPKFTVWSFQ